MGAKITNASSGPVQIRLRSGATLHLAPGEQSPELEDPEVRNNPRLDALVARRLVTLEEPAPAAPPRAGGRRGAASARRPRRASGGTTT
jgi:hypothetical protein